VLALVFHHAGLEALEQRLAVFDEQLAAVAHVEPEAVELDLARAAAETQDHAAAGQLIEHRDLLGDPHRDRARAAPPPSSPASRCACGRPCRTGTARRRGTSCSR
jgi:hypothetical protein